MEIDLGLNVNKYCRGCFQEFETKQGVDMNFAKKHSIFPDLVEKMEACSRLSVDIEDEFSKYICEFCLDKLNSFHSFQTMCIESISRFREILKIHQNQELVDESQLKKEICKNTNTLDDQSTGQNVKTKDLNLIEFLESVDIKVPMMKIQNLLGHTNESESGNETQFGTDNIRLQAKCTIKTFKCKKSLTKGKTIAGETKQPSNIFPCDLCPIKFFVEHRLIAHKRSHDGLIPYPCPKEECNRGFKRRHGLVEHLKQHEGTNRWFICEENSCGKRYKHKTTLDMHLRRFHKKGPELKTFVCEVCGKVFKSSAILNDHRYTHKDKSELPYACDQLHCKYRFSNKEKLKVHLMRHAGIKRYECPHCGMRKTTRNELKIHINYHTLERQFQCRFCTQVCNSAGNLKVHVRTVHERARDYACRFCKRTFAKPDTRKYHEMIHTGEKPHQCVECGKRFIQPAALRTHKKTHLRRKIQNSFESKVREPEVPSASSPGTVGGVESSNSSIG